jgi:hypothetical protein
MCSGWLADHTHIMTLSGLGVWPLPEIHDMTLNILHPAIILGSGSVRLAGVERFATTASIHATGRVLSLVR